MPAARFDAAVTLPMARPATSSANSSRNSRRSDFVVREYRANIAPLTASGRFVSAKTGPSRFVKCGSSSARSSWVNSSPTYVSVMATGSGSACPPRCRG